MEQNKQVRRIKQPQQIEFAKIPPQAVDLEIAVLGAIMLDMECMSVVGEILQPAQFYAPNNAIIYETCLSLKNQNKPIDILTVVQELRKNGNLELVGGAYAVTTMTNAVASTANVEYHARIIQQKSVQRDIIAFCSKTIADGYEDNADIFDLLANVEAGVADLNNKIFIGKTQKIANIWSQVVDRNQKIIEQSGVFGVPSGFYCLDRITGGWQNSDLILLAARPSMGKTSAMVCLASNASKLHDKRGLIFSIEMSALQLGIRFFSVDANESTTSLMRNGLALEQIIQMEKGAMKLINSEIYVDETASITLQQICSKARKFKREKNIDYIMIDYLQLISGAKEKGYGYNREQEVASFSRGLKALAKELNIPIIALAQLSREGGKKGERPTLTTLRESGSLEQDADLVLFIHRPEYYGDLEYSEPLYETGTTSTAGIAEIIIAKHRNGAVGTEKLKWISYSTKFENLNQQNGHIAPNVDFTTPTKEDIFDAPF